MSKISDFIKQTRRTESNGPQTVAEFALAIDRTVDSVLEQLLEAGINVEGPESLLTESHKETLLAHLREAHRHDRNKSPIRIETRAERFVKEVVADENGAEWAALCEFAGEVISDNPIDPKFQRLANLILAKAVILGNLPPSRRGRPVADDANEFGETLAQDFWDMRDDGVPYKVAIGTLSERHHRDERHLSRIIKGHTQSVGQTREERDRRRRWWALVAEMHREHGPSSYFSLANSILDQPLLPELTVEDYLDHLKELLALELPTDKSLAKNL